MFLPFPFHSKMISDKSKHSFLCCLTVAWVHPLAITTIIANGNMSTHNLIVVDVKHIENIMKIVHASTIPSHTGSIHGRELIRFCIFGLP
jgi:hypothetical protein